ncbi:MAG: hypothetical protein EPN21_05070 [Methylococcaceae bacterium]|nr:MAG: hypothetical protein EPN21_05070 [Methylococcaceae bacterium]
MSNPLEKKLEALNALAAPVIEKAAREARQHGSTQRKSPAMPAWPDEGADRTIAPPKPTEAMLYGLVGDVARAASAQSEINPVAAAAGFLSFLGAMVGRDVYYPIGDTWHHPRLFTLHIGRSSRGGKGESLGITRRIRLAIEQEHPDLLGQVHSGGLSSREGLAMLIHDGWTQGRETFEPIHDKRLWVIEGEFANVLHQAKRDGNTLSAALREIWDGGSIRPATKTSRVWASNPHVGLAGAITPSELLGLIRARELSNGFANRFLMFWAERQGEVPFPPSTPPAMLAGLAERTRAVLAFAKGNYPKEQDSRAMHLSHDTRGLWEASYRALKRPLESELLSGLMERRAPHAARLAMLFALTDQSLVIEPWHLRAALAWVDYSTASVRYVFSNQAQEARASEMERLAGMIREFLAGRPDGVELKEITNDCFSRRKTPIPLDEVLSSMLADHSSGLEMEERPRADGRPGRGCKVYRLRLNRCGHSGLSGHRVTTGLSEAFSPADIVRT